ncbi:sphingomyelin phosphodiesterase 5 [Amia ocellicauda]|uniref:sphingomyelin phosphodiesterase 5 n=1 Tax=Amia ocellicauda TaxID=2972642 RepID=UPI0034640F55
MVLRESPFPNGFVAGLHSFAWGLIFPCFWFLDRLIAVCMSTTQEKRERHEQECYLNPLQVFFGAIVFFLLFLLTAPISLLGCILWVPLQKVRRPFCYHRERISIPEDQVFGEQVWSKTGGSFGFVTANLCLLPDSLARFNNLGHTQKRSNVIAHLIIQGVNRPRIKIYVDSPSSGTLSQGSRSSLLIPSSSSYGATDSQPANRPPLVSNLEEDAGNGEVLDLESEIVEGGSNTNSRDIIVDLTDDTEDLACPSMVSQNCNQNSNSCRKAPHKSRKFDDVPWEVCSFFPANVDFVFLEEVFDKRAAQKMKDVLSPVFGHILYDVGIYAFQGCSAFKFFNSGLFFASRYPILEASFRCFPNGRGEDALAAKGVLSVKVQVGQTNQNKKVVGYLNCTHLHAPGGEGQIRCEQLNLLINWVSEFQALTKSIDEIVVFDVLSGDFNFDNCSPDDALEQKHSLFDEYRDPCRAGPGKEKPWVIGTLLEQPTLYDEIVLTPENLQKTLETEELRKGFISPPVPLAGCPLVYPDAGAPWVGRRIDYSLYREETISKHCRTEIEEFTFVTQLAGLTDHIPVGMRLHISMDTEDPE